MRCRMKRIIDLQNSLREAVQKTSEQSFHSIQPRRMFVLIFTGSEVKVPGSKLMVPIAVVVQLQPVSTFSIAISTDESFLK